MPVCHATPRRISDDGTPAPSALREAPLFDRLSAAEVRSLARRFDVQTFAAGRRLVTRGMRGQEFFVILEGRADAVVDGEHVASFGPGDFFGELGILGGAPRRADVVAVTTLRVMELANNALEDVVVEFPRLGANLLREIARRYGERAPGVTASR